jgi:hypothetical protein
MRQLIPIVALAVVVLLGVVVLALGVWPPTPHSQHVQHVVPNDRFK